MISLLVKRPVRLHFPSTHAYNPIVPMTTSNQSLIDRLASIAKRYADLTSQMNDAATAMDFQRVKQIAKERASIEDQAGMHQRYVKLAATIAEADHIITTEKDAGLIELATAEKAELSEQMAKLDAEIKEALTPRDPNDQKNVIFEIRAGAGGEEAALFASELYRLYTRYAQRRGWDIDLIDANGTGIGGYKEVIFEVKGKGAYSRLKHESGVHRVQRVPATESSGRIHTSTVTVAVLPEAEEVDINVNEADLRIDIYHASGHGGQNVQKVATAVRITHIPTGIIATCQDERSQLKNRMKAMAVLRTRLLAIEQEKQQSQITQARRSQVGSGDRSEKVRTYNFPQDRVTDHRVGVSIHSLPRVLDGEIDTLIEALAAQEQKELMEAAG